MAASRASLHSINSLATFISTILTAPLLPNTGATTIDLASRFSLARSVAGRLS